MQYVVLSSPLWPWSRRQTSFLLQKQYQNHLLLLPSGLIGTWLEALASSGASLCAFSPNRLLRSPYWCMARISCHPYGSNHQALFASRWPPSLSSIKLHANVVLFLRPRGARVHGLLLRNHSRNFPFWPSIERASASLICPSQLQGA